MANANGGMQHATKKNGDEIHLTIRFWPKARILGANIRKGKSVRLEIVLRQDDWRKR